MEVFGALSAIYRFPETHWCLTLGSPESVRDTSMPRLGGQFKVMLRSAMKQFEHLGSSHPLQQCPTIMLARSENHFLEISEANALNSLHFSFFC